MLYVSNPLEQTLIFSSLLGLALLLSLKRRRDKEIFPLSATQEIKGLAILAIIFAHIGYGLSTDSRFLWPLTNLAGVGVNIFLLVSGYGLTSSSIKRKLGIRQFYNRRLKKLFQPFWVILALLFLIDLLLLHRAYPADYIARSFLGIFRTADMYKDVDSPLWYFSFILFYYLLYPLVYLKKRPWLSALIIFGTTYALLHYTFIASLDTAGFYEVYTVAFPLGMICAWLNSKQEEIKAWLKSRVGTIRISSSKIIKNAAYFATLAGLIWLAVLSRQYSTPWDSPQKEQFINILTVIALLIFFMLKRRDIRLFYIFGIYSYEIYLFHWPLISRYNLFFGHTSAWLALALYLAAFILISVVLGKVLVFFEKNLKFKRGQ